MSLTDLATIASLVSSAAVLVSLVYLSLQLRQTERNQRSLIIQGSINRASEGIQFATQPFVNDLNARVSSGETNFTAAELNQLRLILRRNLIGLQDTVLQHQSSLIDSSTLENTLGLVRSVLAQPVYRAVWWSSSHTYSAEFAAYVDRLVADVPIAEPRDVVAQFQANLAKALT
jgi:hypothetical protein